MGLGLGCSSLMSFMLLLWTIGLQLMSPSCNQHVEFGNTAPSFDRTSCGL